MSRQGGRGTESKKMVTAGPAWRAHGVGHPGNRPAAGVTGPGPQRPVRRGRAASSGTGRSRLWEVRTQNASLACLASPLQLIPRYPPG
ncbi:hypothetical protein EK904_003582 [Melospiza melodia maxima]|nr:hypothetical protein EK904_003582 [Melospiza melodia maxima]